MMKMQDESRGLSSLSSISSVAILSLSELFFGMTNQGYAASDESNVRHMAPATEDKSSLPEEGSPRLNMPVRSPNVPGTVTVDNVMQFIDHWRKEDQIYITGRLPVDDRQISELRAFLKSHPTWSVYLVEECRMERYSVSSRGISKEHIGIQAISEAIKRDFSPGVTSEWGNKRPDTEHGNIIYVSYDPELEHRSIGFSASPDYRKVGLEEIWGTQSNRIASVAEQKHATQRDLLGTISHVVQSIEHERGMILYHNMAVVGIALAAGVAAHRFLLTGPHRSTGGEDRSSGGEEREGPYWSGPL